MSRSRSPTRSLAIALNFTHIRNCMLSNDIAGCKRMLSIINVNETDMCGWTILHQLASVAEQSPEFYQWFVQDLGANVNARTNLGNTPLHLELQNHTPCLEGVKLLLGARANLSLKNNNNYTPLEILCESTGDDIDMEKSISREVVWLLLEYGSPVSKNAPRYVSSVDDARQCARQIALLFVGIRRFRHSDLNINGMDVARLIGKLIWQNRCLKLSQD